MANQNTQPETETILIMLVRAWDRRLRIQQTLRWLALSLTPGLILGIVLAIISRLQPFLLRQQIINYSLFAMGAGAGVLAIGMIFYPRSIQRAAQHFDVMFRLQERVSTALELVNGRISTSEEFTSRQLDDAVTIAKKVNPTDYIPLFVKWRDWGVVGLLAIILGAMLFLPNPMEDGIIEAAQVNEAIEEAADELQDVQESIAADPTLSEQDRQNLLEELETSLETLAQPEVTTEEAFATLSEIESSLQSLADDLARQMQAQQQALANAETALRDIDPQPGDSAELNEEPRDLNDILEDLANELNEANSPTNQQSLSDALQEAAEALQSANPEASQALSDAAQQLQEGDPQSAQESLNQANEALQQGEQAQQNLSESQQNLQEGAQQAQEAQQNLQQQQMQEQGAQQSGEMEPGGEEQEENGQQLQPEAGQEGESGTPIMGQMSATGTPDGALGGQSEGNGEQAGQGQQSSSQQGGQQPGQQPGSPANPSTGSQSAAATGSGKGAGDEGNGQSESGFADDGAPIDTNNNPDGEGEKEFDSVYAPQRIGGDNGPAVMLEPEGANTPLIEGEFSENPTGTTTVPYNQVFSDYTDAANQALESDYIPLGMRDIVRDYFTSIEPGQ